MKSQSKFLAGAAILALNPIIVDKVHANPVSPTDALFTPPIGFILGSALVVIAIVFSVKAIKKIKKLIDKE
jgi:hypothetical protein